MNNRPINDDVDLRGRTITQPVSLSHLRFRGKVLVNGATFEHGFTIKDSVFEKAVDFSTVISRGPVDFSYSIFRFVPARAKDVSLDLSRTRVEGGLSLKYDCFLGPVDASLMAISGVLSVRNSWFLDRQASEDVPSLDLSNTVVGGSAVLKHNKIQPPVDFGNLIIRGSLDLHDTRIANTPTQDAKSWSCPVPGSPCRTSSFDGLRVEGPATFQGAVLQGCLSLHAASFGAIDPRIDPDAISKSICAEQIPLFEKPGPRDFAGLHLTPDLSVPLDIDGLRYTQIAGGPDAIALMTRLINEHVLDRCQAIEEAIANKQQGIDPCKPSDAKKAQAEAQGEARAGFALLESVAAAQGDRESADKVFVRGRWWEFAHTKPGWSAVSQWISGEYVGFGRRPLQALCTWLGLLLIGAARFWWLQRTGKFLRKGKGLRHVNPLFYSVQCFLPPQWTGHYPAEDFEKPAKWAIGIYVSVAFVLLGVFVYLISGASLPAVFPIALSGAAVVHRVLTVRRMTKGRHQTTA